MDNQWLVQGLEQQTETVIIPTQQIEFPRTLAQGNIEYVTLRPELELCLFDMTFHQDVSMVAGNNQFTVFSGYIPLDSSPIPFKPSELREDWLIRPQSSTLLHPPAPNNRFQFAAETQVKVVAYLTPLANLAQLLSIEELPAPLQKQLETDRTEPFQADVRLTPHLQLIAQQMFACPFEGAIRQLYLEAKTLELMALQLADLKQQLPAPVSLPPREVELIQAARAILLSNLAAPPSLTELAHMVGLNQIKLNKGFRELFGQTAFAYWRQARLEQARYLLEQQLPIKQVAKQIGYAHVSHFTTAFKRQYGVTPGQYLRS